MKLSPGAFDGFLNDIGQDVQWRAATVCPCVNPSSGQAKPTCAHCTGRGRLWADPVAARTGVAGRTVQREWAQFGSWEAGDVVVSIPSDSPLYAIGPYDRVQFLQRSEPFSINLVAGVNIGSSAGPISASGPVSPTASVSHATARLRFPVNRIDHARWIVGANLIEGTVPTVSDDGTLHWPDGTAPPDGASISLTGRRRAEFFCFPESPFDRPHYQGLTLPRRVVLRRFDLLLP